MLRCARRGLRGGPGGRQDPGHPVHAARGPRAELLHLHGAPGGFLPRQHVRVRLRGHQRPGRAPARRCELGGARDAPVDRGLRRRPEEVHGAREEQGRRRPSHGLRSPRL